MTNSYLNIKSTHSGLKRKSGDYVKTFPKDQGIVSAIPCLASASYGVCTPWLIRNGLPSCQQLSRKQSVSVIKYLNLMANIIYLAKGGFLFTLTTVHFIFFGLPALERFLEHQVSVKKIVQDTKSLLPPAVLELEKVFRLIKCFLNI